MFLFAAPFLFILSFLSIASNGSPLDATFARDFIPRVKDAAAEVILAPPATALSRLGEELSGSNVGLAAQNVHAAEKGAFTGEIAVGMLAEVGCGYAIVGHSERRTLFG